MIIIFVSSNPKYSQKYEFGKKRFLQSRYYSISKNCVLAITQDLIIADNNYTQWMNQCDQHIKNREEKNAMDE